MKVGQLISVLIEMLVILVFVGNAQLCHTLSDLYYLIIVIYVNLSGA